MNMIHRNFASLVVLIFVTLFFCGLCLADNGNDFKNHRELRGRHFDAPEQAIAAIKDAFKSEDPNRLIEIFGEEGRNIIISGDLSADKAAMRRISARLDQRAELIPVGSHEHPEESWYKLRYGIEGWNMRIPLISRADSKGWYFETMYAKDSAEEARREINEVIAVDTILDIATAQGLYFQTDHDGDGVKEYAQKIRSTDGKHDGLYWSAKAGEAASPLDKPMAKALQEGYNFVDGKQQPYQGYLYRIITAQGRKTRGGARDYMKGENLTGGFAIIGYPVKWNVSGLRTYIVGSDGKVWGKDLGHDTTDDASDLEEINLDNTWVRIDHRINRVKW